MFLVRYELKKAGLKSASGEYHVFRISQCACKYVRDLEFNEW